MLGLRNLWNLCDVWIVNGESRDWEIGRKLQFVVDFSQSVITLEN